MNRKKGLAALHNLFRRIERPFGLVVTSDEAGRLTVEPRSTA
jgi:hypothetical protein